MIRKRKNHLADLMMIIIITRYINSKLPKKKQTLAFSATFTEDLLATFQNMMCQPQIVRLTTDVPELEGNKKNRVYIYVKLS